jgi:hypothetical protein
LQPGLESVHDLSLYKPITDREEAVPAPAAEVQYRMAAELP